MAWTQRTKGRATGHEAKKVAQDALMEYCLCLTNKEKLSLNAKVYERCYWPQFFTLLCIHILCCVTLRFLPNDKKWVSLLLTLAVARWLALANTEWCRWRCCTYFKLRPYRFPFPYLYLYHYEKDIRRLTRWEPYGPEPTHASQGQHRPANRSADLYNS